MEAISLAMGSRKVLCLSVLTVNISSDRGIYFYLFILNVS